jgi:predicted transcriptional regulator of viral defense system
MMNFLEFRNKMFDLACFNIDQVYAWQPDFDRNNLSRWSKKGLLIRLRQGYFTFPEYKNKRDFVYYFANRIYRPSYVSLHTALAFYGMIPETVVQITNVTSLKTASFENVFGEFIYKSLNKNLMFGYDLKPMEGGRTLQFAKPEKALLDLLYLYPEYNSKQDLINLRLDEDFLQDQLNMELLLEYTLKFKSKTVQRRINLFISAYQLPDKLKGDKRGSV